MKNNKVFLLLFILICSISVNVQSQSDWSTSGNSLYSGDFLGSTNNIDLKFKVNNQLGGLINMSAYNTFLGYTAGNAITSGTNNSFMGYEGGLSTTTGSYNTAFGTTALRANTTASYNIAMGYRSLYNNTKVSNNTALGTQALYSMSYNTTAFDGDNVAVGFRALYSNQPNSTSNGYRNTALGSLSLYTNTIGRFNTAVGQNSVYANDSGSYNTGIGNAALYYNFSGNYNTAIGTNSLFYNRTASNNVGLGFRTLYNNRYCQNNTAIGTQALYSMSFANNNSIYNGDNVAVGYQALYSNQPTASNNGYRNTALGAYAMYFNVTGLINTALGYSALFSNESGTANTAVGSSVLYRNITGNGNTAIGDDALDHNQSGNYNTAIGAGTLTTCNGDYNTALGYLAEAGSNINRAMALGYNATATADDEIQIGTVANTGSTGGYGNWQNWSDGRFKENIKEDVPGLIFIKKLRPITYTFDAQKIDEFIGIKQRMDTIKDENEKKRYYERLKEVSTLIQTGFIAQEVEATANEIGYSFDGVHKPVNEKDNYTIGYATFVVPLVKAVQEQQGMIDSMKTKIKNQEAISDSLQDLIVKQQTIIDTSKIAKLNERLTLLEALVNECCSKNSGEKKLIMQDVELSDAQAIVLDQNLPNPFAESTIISYFIPDNVSFAQIIFTDNTGKVLKTVKITEKGKGMLKVFGQDLSSGIYSYTLVADGKTIDSKSMIKLK